MAVLSVVPAAPELIRLDIGCGHNKREGFTGMDITNVEGVDVVHSWDDVPWPFADESVEEINCSHVLEHTKDLVAFMNECWRVLIPDGKMSVVAPYYTSVRAWGDPTHLRAINEWTFMYFNKAWRETNKLTHYQITADFDFSYGYNMNGEWMSRSEEARLFALMHYWNVADDIVATLTKRPR